MFKKISDYRSELMGIAIIGVMITHALMYIDIQPSLKGVLFNLSQVIYTEGFLLLSGFGLFFSVTKNGVGGGI